MMALLTSTELDPQAFQEFLDQKQYSLNGITRYERVFGAGFVSTGGIETTAEFVKMLNLKEGACLITTHSYSVASLWERLRRHFGHESVIVL
jgi:hypothetical protein